MLMVGVLEHAASKCYLIGNPAVERYLRLVNLGEELTIYRVGYSLLNTYA